METTKLEQGNDMITHNKLVRDRITDIIQQSGKTYKARKLKKDEFLDAIYQKFNEEVQEFQVATNKKDQIEELADILELVHAATDVLDISYGELEVIREEKYKKRGGFEKRIFLETVED